MIRWHTRLKMTGKSGDPVGYVERDLSIETFRNGRPRKTDFIIEKLYPETAMISYNLEKAVENMHMDGRLSIDSLLYNLRETKNGKI